MSEKYRGANNDRHPEVQALREWTAQDSERAAQVEEVLGIRRQVSTEIRVFRAGGSRTADSAPAISGTLPDVYAGNGAEKPVAATNGVGELAAAAGIVSGHAEPMRVNRVNSPMSYFSDAEPFEIPKARVPKVRNKFSHGSKRHNGGSKRKQGR